MRRRLLAALWWAVLIHVVASCPTAAQDDPEDCEPLTAASLVDVGSRFNLDADQLRWLADRFRARRLRSPEDLDDLPGLGPELREDLESAWCWAGAWEGRLDLAARAREDGPLREARLITEGVHVGAEVRARERPGEEVLTRGSLTGRAGPWCLRVGSLRLRQGLGMLLATPGAETRGSAPLRESAGGWRGSLSLDPETVTGLAVRRETRSGWTEGALLRGTPAGSDARWATASLGRRRGETQVGLFCVGGAGSGAWSLQVAGASGAGRWTLEWARGASGSAQGAAWAMADGPWRFRASVSRQGGDYRLPTVRLYRDPPGEDMGELRLETRWQGGSGRHLRLALAEERGPAPYGVPWTRRQSERTLEFSERLHRRLRAAALWRSRFRRLTGSAPDGDGRERLMRLDLLYRGSPWQVDLRVEERSAPEGLARFTMARLGRTGTLSWQLVAGLAGLDGEAPDLWWYRRRAGGLYGWDRLGEGTWVGAWARLTRGRWGCEISAANRRAGWGGGLALRMDLGSPVKLDPHP
jgi:hypothetical protein